ncbi:MAG TPA: response regulator [Anaerohalosphaeraceae bacterium]|jgi:HD-like signal output (HDOD) protein|nr:response regulator [Anaerohalosphaeraceae bacterium]HRT49421.1 response regulator [Anaerohalosphaeraceae bacterium]HRT85415.1 response regulator [Anaerohalosphaeraceae bacterium]
MNRVIRILFVDDDVNVLNGLRRMLHKMRQQWEMEFVTSGAEALQALKQTPYNIVVSDLRMPDMNGVELLEKVRQRYPDAIRFMLSGYSDQPLRGQAARCVHQFVSKPCDADQLQSLIHRAFQLNDRLRSKEAAKVLSNLSSLPVMSDTYKEVIDALSSPDCSPRKVGKMIARDIGMSAKILQLVNSAFYGSGSKIADPVHAVVYLGLKTVEALVLTSGIFSKLPERRIKEFSVDALQEHCVRTGTLAKAICKSLQMSQDEMDIASMAGILHDTGKIVLIARFPREWAEAIQQSRQRQVPLYTVERELLEVTHAELGGGLLDLWGLPNTIIEAATYHHEFPESLHDGFSVISAVRLANMIDHELCCGLADGYTPPLDTALVESFGVADRIDQWRSIHLRLEAEEHEYVG